MRGAKQHLWNSSGCSHKIHWKLRATPLHLSAIDLHFQQTIHPGKPGLDLIGRRTERRLIRHHLGDNLSDWHAPSVTFLCALNWQQNRTCARSKKRWRDGNCWRENLTFRVRWRNSKGVLTSCESYDVHRCSCLLLRADWQSSRLFNGSLKRGFICTVWNQCFRSKHTCFTF